MSICPTSWVRASSLTQKRTFIALFPDVFVDSYNPALNQSKKLCTFCVLCFVTCTIDILEILANKLTFELTHWGRFSQLFTTSIDLPKICNRSQSLQCCPCSEKRKKGNFSQVAQTAHTDMYIHIYTYTYRRISRWIGNCDDDASMHANLLATNKLGPKWFSGLAHTIFCCSSCWKLWLLLLSFLLPPLLLLFLLLLLLWRLSMAVIYIIWPTRCNNFLCAGTPNIYHRLFASLASALGSYICELLLFVLFFCLVLSKVIGQQVKNQFDGLSVKPTFHYFRLWPNS